MSRCFKHPEHLKLNHYNYMTWRKHFRVDLSAFQPTKSQSATSTIPLARVTRPHFAFSNKNRNASERAILSARADNAKSKSATSTV